MSININLIDSRVQKLAEDLAQELAERFNIKGDVHKARSASFVFLVVKTMLDLPDEEALDCITEGGNDFGIDAIHIGSVEDNEFAVTLFQGKYKKELTGDSAFPQTGVEKTVQAIRYLFNPHAQITANPMLKRKIEEIRSFVNDGFIPNVRVILCSNGIKWNEAAQRIIDLAAFPEEQVSWQFINHEDLVKLRLNPKKVKDKLRLMGKALVEDFEYSRVLIGKIPVEEMAALFNRHGDLLLERNVRRFLGLQGHRVNQDIAHTLTEATEQGNFYFYNNGITMICDKFSLDGLQDRDFQVQVEGLQVINGGQTCKTIQNTLAQLAGAQTGLAKAFVLVRLYQLPSESDDLVRSITYATNSQNPVDLRDLKSNDPRQKSLAAGVHDLGYNYHRFRSDSSLKSEDISSAVAAQSIISVWRQHPHQAKFQGREHFGKLYETIFSADLNAAQLVLATLIYRSAENKRRRPPADAPDFIGYASGFIAMLMGRTLLSELGINLNQLDHRKFTEAKARFQENEEAYYQKSVQEIDQALKQLYTDKKVSLQRLSATFRRGDLLEYLLNESRPGPNENP